MKSSSNGVHESIEGNDNHKSQSKKSRKQKLLAAKSNKKQREQFKFGNYQNYYFKRLGSEEALTDFRLELFEAHPEYFKGKSILDIGCNSGFITINFAKKLHPASILGIDIDGSLVDKAKRNLEKQKIDKNSTQLDLDALNKVTFRKANYILKDESLLNLERPHYDAILCLSVTKWIHLNHGDAGVKFLFKRIFKQLMPNGVFLLEAQAYKTYHKRSKLSPEILNNYKSIQLKPEQFEAYLLSDEVGFSESWCLANQEILKATGLPKGFHRPLQVFIKR